MFAEALHRVIKVVYFNSKHNRCIEFLLTTLMKLARDKAFERLLKVEKGKNTNRITEINKRHQAAINMKKNKVNVTLIKQVSSNTYCVKSQTSEISRTLFKD